MIAELITTNGPILSSDLIQAIKENSTESLNDEALRKRLSRLPSTVRRLKGIFSQKQALYYDADIYGSPEYFEGLRDALKKAGKQYAYLLEALEFHYGSLPVSQLSAYGVNPQTDSVGHLTFDTALFRLRELNLVSQWDDNIRLNDVLMHIPANERHARAVLLAKDILLLQFNDWARKIGLVSYNTGGFYVNFHNYGFAFVSPSYISTLATFKEGKILPGFVVADVLVGNNISVEAVEFFVKKIDILKARRGLRPFIPFLLVDGLEPDALALLKSKGIVIGFVNQLFGPQYQELLNLLVKEVTNAGAMLKKNPETFIKLLHQLTALVSGKTNNLKGDLFEMAVGYYHSKMGSGLLDIGKKIFQNNDQREMDVFAVYGNKVVIAECKAYNFQVDKSYIEEWVSEKIPVIRDWILSSPTLADKAIEFQYWATGGFDESAWELINRIEPKTKKHKLEFLDQARMLEKSKQAKSTKFTELIHEYFFKDSTDDSKVYEGQKLQPLRGRSTFVADVRKGG
jgi:hypothetical protein